MVSTKTLIIHIGTEKTGTTSLQQFLFANAKDLEGRGILYPSDLHKSYCQHSAHFPLGATLTDDWHDIVSQDKEAKFRNSLSDFCSDSKQSSAPVTVISSEHFSSRGRDRSKLQSFRDQLSRHFGQIRIACYIRRQPDMVLGNYYTAVLHGRRQPLDLASVSSKDSYFNHLAMLDLWSDVFGPRSLIVREYDKQLLESGDICSDFCSNVLRIDNSALKRSGEVNVSRGVVFVELIRQLNLVSPALEENVSGWRAAQRIRSLIAANLAINNDPRLSLGQEDEQAIITAFLDINREINRKYLGGSMSESWFQIRSKIARDALPSEKWITERTLNSMSSLVVELLRPPKGQ